MLCFGLGTVPALLGTAAIAARVPLGRVAVQRFMGISVALWGGVLLYHGAAEMLA